MQLNGAMLALFGHALRRATSLQATVLTIAANICFTGQLGQLLYGERLDARWWVGAGCIVLGALLIRPQTPDQARSPPPRQRRPPRPAMAAAPRRSARLQAA